MSHADAHLAPMGRLSMVQRVEAGMAQAHVAAQVGISRAMVAKWIHNCHLHRHQRHTRLTRTQPLRIPKLGRGWVGRLACVGGDAVVGCTPGHHLWGA